MKQSLGSVVVAARVAKRPPWTQVYCAKRAKVSASLVADIERGAVERILPLTAAKLERALGVSLAQFVKRSA